MKTKIFHNTSWILIKLVTFGRYSVYWEMGTNYVHHFMNKYRSHLVRISWNPGDNGWQKLV